MESMAKAGVAIAAGTAAMAAFFKSKPDSTTFWATDVTEDESDEENIMLVRSRLNKQTFSLQFCTQEMHFLLLDNYETSLNS